jgi:hypothetical protein
MTECFRYISAKDGRLVEFQLGTLIKNGNEKNEKN